LKLNPFSLLNSSAFAAAAILVEFRTILLVLPINDTILAALFPLSKYFTNALSVGANNVTLTKTANKLVWFKAAHKIENSVVVVASQIISSMVGKGASVGGLVGARIIVGATEVVSVGATERDAVGVSVSSVVVGFADGATVEGAVGVSVFALEGVSVGVPVGESVGGSVSFIEGVLDGEEEVGVPVGDSVGVYVVGINVSSFGVGVGASVSLPGRMTLSTT